MTDCSLPSGAVPPSRYRLKTGNVSSYESVKRWRWTTKRRLVIAFGGRCACCGVVDHEVVYDFHHMDRETKDFILTRKIRPWTKIVAEALKCVMLCSHCHRKVHIGLIEVPADAPRLDEALVANSDLAVRVGPEFDHCPVCQDLKSVLRSYCSQSCSARSRWTGKKPKDLLALRDRVVAQGFRSVAKEIGVSDNSIRDWLADAGIDVPRFRGPQRIHL